MSGEQKPVTDWERIQADYRAGVKSLREIAAEHGLSHAAIAKRAKKEEWPRDLQAKIRAKADELVSRAAVTALVTVETKAAERQTVEANAEAIAQVRLGHRADIRKGRGVVNKLLAELEGVTDQPDLIEDLKAALVDPEDDSQAAEQRRRKLNEALQRVTELPARVTAVKGLAEAMKNLIALERQAWGLENETGAGGSYEDFLQSLNS